jgi:hypothetical protein
LPVPDANPVVGHFTLKLTHYRVSASSDSLCESRAFRQTETNVPVDESKSGDQVIDKGDMLARPHDRWVCCAEPRICGAGGGEGGSLRLPFAV